MPDEGAESEPRDSHVRTWGLSPHRFRTDTGTSVLFPQVVLASAYTADNSRGQPLPFAGIYERARQLGFHTSAHAGEAAGPESVWGAINSLKVERIGHGTRAVEDRALVAYIAEHRIPIEICLLSNVKTRVVESVDKHPVRYYFERGIPISINTDDPKMFGNSLAEEYQVLETTFGFSREDIRRAILQGIEASWLPEDRKHQLIQRFRNDPVW